MAVVHDVVNVGEYCEDLGRVLTWSDRRMRFNISADGQRKFAQGSYVEVLTQPDGEGRVEIHQRGVFGLVLSVDLEPVVGEKVLT